MKQAEAFVFIINRAGSSQLAFFALAHGLERHFNVLAMLNPLCLVLKNEGVQGIEWYSVLLTNRSNKVYLIIYPHRLAIQVTKNNGIVHRNEWVYDAFLNIFCGH